MKMNNPVFRLLGIMCLVPAMTLSCIGPEPLNSEADILEIILPEDYCLRTPVVLNDSISVTLCSGVDRTSLAPEFILTPGASIVPESGTALDFTKLQYYTVTSEDGKWSKQYSVFMTMGGIEVSDCKFVADFETTHVSNLNYSIFDQFDAAGNIMFNWSSGNAGYAMTGKPHVPGDFPTSQNPEGHTGACLELVTLGTGAFGALMGRPIAAGSLFTGFFDAATSLTDAFRSLQLGLAFKHEPLVFSGWYSYSPGPVFCRPDRSSADGLTPVPGVTDRPTICAILFESTAQMPYQNGGTYLSDDNENVICRALLPDSMAVATDGWKPFSLDFVPLNGRSIDRKKLEEGRYSLAIVFSSSNDGGNFRAAVGSRLLIDDVCITVKE